MKRLFFFICFLCPGLLLQAQQGDGKTSGVAKEIDAMYEAAATPGSLSRDGKFLGILKEALKPGNATSAYVLDKYRYYIYMNGMMKDATASLRKMPMAVKQSEAGQRAQAFHNRMQEVKVGDQVPDFTFNTPEGKPLALYDYLKGKKLVLIDFWASWCGPCRAEAKNVREIYDKFHAKGFDVFGVSLDENLEAWKKAIADDDIVWGQVSDLKGWKTPACKWFNFNGIPCMFLVDGNGKILARDLRGEALARKVAEICK